MSTERELELLIVYLRDKPVSQEQEKYQQLLYNIQYHPHKQQIITNIFKNIDNPTVFLSIVPGYFKTEGTESSPSISMQMIEKSMELCLDTQTNYDILCKILFSCLEVKKIPLEVKSVIFKIFEEIEFSIEYVRRNAFSMLQYDHTTNILTEAILYISALRSRSKEGTNESHGRNREEESDVNSGKIDSIQGDSALSDILIYLLRESEISKSPSLHKNYSSIIVRVSESVRQHGLGDVIGPVLESISSEIQCIRNAATECTVVVSKGLKQKIEEERRGDKELSTIIEAVIERTVDVSPFCRSRAIQSLTEILQNNGILEGAKEKVYESVHERIMDKTQIVRRKAILFFKTALETHPYSLDGGTLSIERLEKHRSTDEVYYKSASIFYGAIYKTIETIKELLKAGSKGEVSEIIQYVSLCYSYGVTSALDIFPALFLFSWQRVPVEGRNIADTISEELRKMADGSPKKLIELLIYFDTNSLSYEGIIRELALRGILGIEAVNTLFYHIDQADDKIPYLRLLRRITTTDRSVTEGALGRMGEVLQSSKDVSVVSEVIRILGNLDYRVGNRSEIVQCILDKICNVNENNLELLQSIIDTSYLISTEPDYLAVEILDRLTEQEKYVPLIFAVGHIAIKKSVHLERVEAAWNHQTKQPEQAQTAQKEPEVKRRKESISHPEIRERRLSVGSRRNTVKNTTEEQEEMADRIFFAKEHEILFGDNSALKGSIEIVLSGIHSTVHHVRRISLLSLGKMMSVSSECSSRHMHEVVNILKTGPSDLQIIALVIISDSIMAFSSLVKDAGSSLFIPIKSEETEVKKTALVLIRHLLRSGMVKVKDNYWALSLLLLEGPDIRSTSQKLFEEASERGTPMKIVCEVIKSYVIDRYSKETEQTGHIKQTETDQNENETEQTDQNEKQSEHALLGRVIKSLIKIVPVPDLSKKLTEWAASKDDSYLNEVCSFIVEEIGRTVTVCV